MNFITKYLPAEGEIKEGVIVIDKYGLTYPINNYIATHPLLDEIIERNGMKPAKLNLCTRDIQVGDLITFRMGDHSDYPWIEASTPIKEITERYIILTDNGSGEIAIDKLNNFNYLKVLGEISKEAVWLTDNMTEEDFVQVSELMEYEDDYYDDDNKRVSVEEVIEQDVIQIPLYESHKIASRSRWKDAPDEVEVRVFLKKYEIKCPTCKHFH